MEERLSVAAGTGRPCAGSYLAGALHTPHVGALPPDVAVLAVIVTVLLLQELDRRTADFSHVAPERPSFQSLGQILLDT